MNAPLRAKKALVVAVFGGVLFALTAPPTNLYPMVVIGLALLAVAIADAPTGWRAFGRGVAWGTAAGIVGLRFIPTVILRFTSLGMAAALISLVLLSAAQSVIWGIAAAIASSLQRRARVPLEIAFGAGVFVATWLPTVFAWTPAGLMSPWPSLVQLADLIGERGVSAILGVVAALLARALLACFGLEPGRSLLFARKPALERAALTPFAGAVGIVLFLVLVGKIRISSIESASESVPTVRVALLDQSVGPMDRWDPKNHASILHTLRDLTHKAESEGAELTVWPEAAYPYVLEHDAKHSPKGFQAPVGGTVRGPILMGLITRAPTVEVSPGHVENNSFNSATVVFPDGTLEPSYDKLQLLWFGEMVPGGQQLPWLRRIFQKSGGLIPGTEVRALLVPRGMKPGARGAAPEADPSKPSLEVAVLNCYEDTLADVGLRLARGVKPNILVNVTNDAWFFGTPEPELHARLAVMRAVEQRRDLVRAVNMGVASWVDAAGVVRARYDKQEPGILAVTPAVRNESQTLYARFGDRPFAALLVAAIAALAIRARRAKAAEDDEDEPKKDDDAVAATSSREPAAVPAADPSPNDRVDQEIKESEDPSEPSQVTPEP